MILITLLLPLYLMALSGIGSQLHGCHYQCIPAADRGQSLHSSLISRTFAGGLIHLYRAFRGLRLHGPPIAAGGF